MAYIVVVDANTLRWIIDHRKSRTRELKNRFLRSIRPVFEQLPNGKPDAVGTCVLLQIQGKRFILSAAHVFDFFKTQGHRLNRLYIDNRGRFLDITVGELYRTGKPGDNRDNDRIDAGIIALPENACPELPQADFLQMSDLELNPPATNAPLYIGIGFPLANHSYAENHLNMDGITCTGPSVCEKVEPLGFDHGRHIVVEYDRYDMWVGEHWSEAPEPIGMSGGALFRFDSLGSNSNSGYEDKLAGILIEKHDTEKVIVATRIGVFIEMIRSVYPSLFIDSRDSKR